MWFALLLLLPMAAVADELTRLERLLQDGRYASAHALAREHRAALEGEPRFDTYYGIAALKSGHPGEAVFALRRVMAVRPSPALQFRLAGAWLALGHDLQARQEFEAVLSRDPPAPLRARVERHLLVLDRRASHYRTTVRGHIEIGGGHDTNVTTATDDESIALADRTITSDQLGDGARRQADDFARVAGAVEVAHPLRPALGVFGEAEGERRYHGEWRGSETGHLQLRAGLRASVERLRTTLAARGRRFYRGGERYRDTAGLDARLRYQLSSVQVGQAALGLSRLRHTDAGRRAGDSELATLVVGTTRLWQAPLRPTLALFALIGQQAAATDSAETAAERSLRADVRRDLHGLGGELRLRLTPRWALHTGLHTRHSSHRGADPTFDRRRRDEYTRGNLTLRWQVIPRWRAQAQLSRSVNDSNIGFHDYERERAELSLRYQF